MPLPEHGEGVSEVQGPSRRHSGPDTAQSAVRGQAADAPQPLRTGSRGACDQRAAGDAGRKPEFPHPWHR